MVLSLFVALLIFWGTSRGNSHICGRINGILRASSWLAAGYHSPLQHRRSTFSSFISSSSLICRRDWDNHLASQFFRIEKTNLILADGVHRATFTRIYYMKSLFLGIPNTGYPVLTWRKYETVLHQLLVKYLSYIPGTRRYLTPKK